jgi:hypothetical protein
VIKRFISVSIVVAFALAAPSVAHAQEPRKEFVALTTDSSAWQSVLMYTVQALSGTLVRSATDPTAQPWRVEFPSDDPQEALIRGQLRTILRIRQVMPADTLVRSLEFGKLVITGDTARVEVRFTETRTCPGSSKTTGSSWSTTVLVPREPKQKFWGAGRSRSTAVGDRLPC